MTPAVHVLMRHPVVYVLCVLLAFVACGVFGFCAFALMRDDSLIAGVACSVACGVAFGALFRLVALEEREDRARRARRVAS